MAGEATAGGAAVGTAISPGVGTVIGAGLGLAGDLLGMGSSKSESHKNRKEARRQFNIQMDESIQRRVADALKAGINPLTALGYNGGASPTVHTGSSSGGGEYLSRAGDRFQHMMEKLSEEKAVDDIEYDSQVKELDLESRRLENRILQQKLDAGTHTPATDIEPPKFSGDTSDLLFVPVYDANGDPRMTVNQNVMEMDSDNAGYRSSILKTYKKLYKEGKINRDGQVTSQAFLDQIDNDYYERTGKHIKNLGNAYFSGTEAGFVTFDTLVDLLSAFSGMRKAIDK